MKSRILGQLTVDSGSAEFRDLNNEYTPATEFFSELDQDRYIDVEESGPENDDERNSESDSQNM